MRIVYLHDVELLDNLSVDLDLLCFELWDDLLSEVNGDDVVQYVETLNFLICLQDSNEIRYKQDR